MEGHCGQEDSPVGGLHKEGSRGGQQVGGLLVGHSGGHRARHSGALLEHWSGGLGGRCQPGGQAWPQEGGRSPHSFVCLKK